MCHFSPLSNIQFYMYIWQNLLISLTSHCLYLLTHGVYSSLSQSPCLVCTWKLKRCANQMRSFSEMKLSKFNYYFIYMLNTIFVIFHSPVVSNFTKPLASELYVIAWASYYDNDVHSSRMDLLVANVSVLSHRGDYITLIAFICRDCRIQAVEAVNTVVSRLSGIWDTLNGTVIHSGSQWLWNERD